MTENKKRKTTTVILIVLGVFVLFFTLGCMWMFYKFQTVPDSLIVAVFGAVFGEVSVCGWIKTVKTKFEREEDEDEN